MPTVENERSDEGKDYRFPDISLALLAVLEQGDRGNGATEDVNGVIVFTGTLTGQSQSNGPYPGRFRTVGMLMPAQQHCAEVGHALRPCRLVPYWTATVAWRARGTHIT